MPFQIFPIEKNKIKVNYFTKNFSYYEREALERLLEENTLDTAAEVILAEKLYMLEIFFKNLKKKSFTAAMFKEHENNYSMYKQAHTQYLIEDFNDEIDLNYAEKFSIDKTGFHLAAGENAETTHFYFQIDFLLEHKIDQRLKNYLNENIHGKNDKIFTLNAFLDDNVEILFLR